MITLAGAAVLEGRLSLPRGGNWVAQLELGADEAPTGPVDLDDGEGSVFTGTVIRSGMIGPRAHCEVVGGTAGLRRKQAPQHFRTTTVGQVVAAILAAAGEQADPNTLPSSTSTALGFWSTQEASGGANLESLCSKHGLLWRVRPSGKVWVGPPTEGLESPGEAYVLDGNAGAPCFLCAPDGFWLLPGMEQSRGIVERVEYDVGEHLRARYWVSDG
jgi:hypothetical protein